jgi:AcrR family transcriptional regulator
MSPPNVRGTTERKKARFREIIEIGRDLFVNESEKGFSTIELAKRVNIKQASLYKYIESKRELWFAIVTNDLEEIVTYLENIIHNFTGSAYELLPHIIKCYFDYVIANAEKISLQYRISPPNSNSQKSGPFEKKYHPAEYYGIFLNVIEAVIKEKQIKVKNPKFFMYFLFSIVHGATLLIGERGFTSDPIEFKDYVMAQFNQILRSYQ